MSTCSSTIQPLLQQTTNIWKIPAQNRRGLQWNDAPALQQTFDSADQLQFHDVVQVLAVLCSSFVRNLSNQRKNRRENCSTAASQSGCVHLRSIERARYATKHLRDTDGDYVMKKPLRCWLGAVPRYWKVVASCFQFVSFAENTSAPFAPRARIFQPILLLFFLFSCSWICLQNGVSDFFIRSQNLVAFKRRQNLLKKGYFRTFSNV